MDTTAVANLEEEEALHRRRLAQVLRYIASMHHSLGTSGGGGGGDGSGAAGSGHSFVREVSAVSGRASRAATESPDFFQECDGLVLGPDGIRPPYDDDQVAEESRRCGVLFSTDNFRRLLAVESEDTTRDPSSSSPPPLFEKAPFSFYAAAGSSSQAVEQSNNGKRTLSGALKTAFGVRQNGRDSAFDERGGGYWLRITRLSASQVAQSQRPSFSSSHPAVQTYIRDWIAASGHSRGGPAYKFLTLGRFASAPKIPPTASSRDRQRIISFLHQYKTFLRMRVFRDALEPMYNRLFEWTQQQNQHDHLDELVFGIGHARMLAPDKSVLINGPLLEVLVEVDLAKDGALMIRPREHTGVALNREVVAALTSLSKGGNSDNISNSGLAQLHRDIAELEPSRISPGQPGTYVPILKRIAVELSPGGSFRPSSNKHRSTSFSADDEYLRLVVSEAWCLYSRPKPSSVWARDAIAFADQLMIPAINNTTNAIAVPSATWSITHGPGALEKIIEDNLKSTVSVYGGFVGMIQKAFLGRSEARENEIKHPSAARPLFPLPTSETQNRIAELLLTKNYPAVVCEGPPGTYYANSAASQLFVKDTPYFSDCSFFIAFVGSYYRYRKDAQYR